MREQPLTGILFLIAVLLFTQRIIWQAKVIWGYFLITTAMNTFRAYYPTNQVAPVAFLVAWSSTIAFCFLSFTPLLLLHTSDSAKAKIINILKWYTAYDACLLLLGSPGVFSANTFDAVLIACFILFWDAKKMVKFKKLSIPFEALAMLICLSSIVYVRGRDAMLVISIMFSIRLLQIFHKRFQPIVVKLTGLLMSIIGLVSLYFLRHHVSDVRLEMWDNFMSWWSINVNIWLGTGVGTFEWIGLSLKSATMFEGKNLGFYVMHNDWLQLLFETGIIGLTLTLSGFVLIALRLRDKYLATWIGISVGMIFYYPSHTHIIQILALTLIIKAVEIKNNQEIL